MLARHALAVVVFVLLLGCFAGVIFVFGSFAQHRQGEATNGKETRIDRNEDSKQNQATSVTEAGTSGTAAPRADLDDRTALQETLHTTSDLAHPKGRGPPATAAGRAVSESAIVQLERWAAGSDCGERRLC